MIRSDAGMSSSLATPECAANDISAAPTAAGGPCPASGELAA